MLALKGKAEDAVKSETFNPRIIKYIYMCACVLDTSSPFEIAQKKSADESRAPVLRRQGAQGGPQLTELSALQCFPLRCAGTQVSCTVWAQPSTSPQRDALMLEARWRLHVQNRLAGVRVNVLGCTYVRLFRPPSGLEGAGLGILAGTSPLQHFFFLEGEEGGGRGGCLMGASTCP